MKARHCPALALTALLGFLAAATLASSCQRTAKVEVPVAAIFEGERTYAWSGEVPASDRTGQPAEQDPVSARLREELESQLEGKGFQKAGARVARFQAALYLGVEPDTRSSDPLFTNFPYERIERGYAVLTLTEAEGRSSAPAWTGTTDATLRVTERGTGQDKIRWEATNEPRSWPVDSISSALGDRLPAAHPTSRP